MKRCRCVLLILLFAVALSAQTRVVMLGTGTPVANPFKSGPASAVIVNHTAYLVDCGPGVVRRAALAARRGFPALRVARIHYVFITHLHTDHTLGYPDLIFSPWVLGRKMPLEAYGPAGLKAMTAAIMQAWSVDIHVRTTGLEHASTTGYHVDVHEIQPGVVYRDRNVTVTAFRVHHGNQLIAYGYKFKTADRTIVFSGDTSPLDIVARECDGCDLLFHEVYNRRGTARREPDQLPYFHQYHTSPRELCRIAALAHPKLLVLYHQVLEGLPESDLLAQVQACYKGAVVSAHDLDVY
ncbi:MAG: MBL fold metallo-hydrolase [Terriglobales bacterium]